MTRSRASAAGTRFETLVAAFLAAHVDERIERRARHGNKDRGDIAGLTHLGQRIVVECKNTTKINLAGWVNEDTIEAGNDDAIAGVVVHKRHGKSAAGLQWVTMTLADFVAILTAEQPGVSQ